MHRKKCDVAFIFHKALWNAPRDLEKKGVWSALHGCPSDREMHDKRGLVRE